MAESDKLTLVAEIAASYLRRNSVGIDQIGAVVSSVTNVRRRGKDPRWRQGSGGDIGVDQWLSRGAAARCADQEVHSTRIHRLSRRRPPCAYAETPPPY